MTTPSSDDGKAKAISLALPTLHMQEVSSLLTPEKLDGTNYVEWALNAQNKIRAGSVGDLFLVQRLHPRIPLQMNMKHGKMTTA
ncbi:hypothetical protein AAC387_Pa12g1791 [Persea americana]